MVSTSAAFRSLQVTRAQLTALCGKDTQLMRQFERLFSLAAATNSGVPVVEDVDLDADGLTLAVEVDVGRYYFELTALLTVVGGSAGNGWAIEAAGTATVAAGSWLLLAGTPAAMTANQLARPIPTLTDNVAESTIILRGFVDVQQRGTLGFLVRLDGAPTSATLVSGSGLLTTIVKEWST